MQNLEYLAVWILVQYLLNGNVERRLSLTKSMAVRLRHLTPGHLVERGTACAARDPRLYWELDQSSSRTSDHNPAGLLQAVRKDIQGSVL